KVSGSEAAAFLVRLLTDINPNDPKSLMAGELPGMSAGDAVLLRGGSGTDAAVGPQDNRPIPGAGDEAVGDGSASPGSETDPGQQSGDPGDAGELVDDGGAFGEQPEPQQPNAPPSGSDMDDPAKPTTSGRKVVFIYHSHNRESWIPELPADT